MFLVFKLCVGSFSTVILSLLIGLFYCRFSSVIISLVVPVSLMCTVHVMCVTAVNM